MHTHNDLTSKRLRNLTISQLNFVPLESAGGAGDVVATINASTEGITISAGKISISGSTVFSAGYDPTSKVDEVGGNYASAASGARVLIFPDSTTGIQVIDNAANDVFKVIVGGTNVGDVYVGNYAGSEGIFYDKSANTTTIKGSFTAGDITGATIAIGSADTIFKTDINGNSHWGNALYASAPAKIANTGAAIFSNITITGGTVAGSVVSTGISASNITTGTLSADRISAGSLNANKITAGTITATQIAADAITATHIVAGTITADEIANSTITGVKIANTTITSAKIADLSASKITAGTISASISISAPTITGGSISAASISSGSISGASILGSVFKTSDSGANVYISSAYIWLRDGVTNKITMYAASGAGSRIETDGVIIGGAVYGTNSVSAANYMEIQGTNGAGYLALRNQGSVPGGQSGYTKLWCDGYYNLFLVRNDGLKALITKGAWY